MDGRGPDTPGGEPKGRGVDALVWITILAFMVAIAGGVAWLVSNARFELPKITFTEQVEEVTLVEPAPPVAAPSMDPAVAPSPEPPPTVGPNGEVVMVPAWIRQPAPEYPALAASLGIESGAATLLCRVRASGEIGTCAVLAERPSGAGFADAAVQGARGARVRPRTVDGVETESSVRFTVRFRLEP